MRWPSRMSSIARGAPMTPGRPSSRDDGGVAGRTAFRGDEGTRHADDHVVGGGGAGHDENFAGTEKLDCFLG
jgi:hypothetical protein